MKKVIKGKSYNTGTATLLMSCWNDIAMKDPFYTAEELYRTENGDLFIRGEGGCLTRYSIIVNEERVPGAPDIRVVTKEQAEYWIRTRTSKTGNFFTNPTGGKGVKI